MFLFELQKISTMDNMENKTLITKINAFWIINTFFIFFKRYRNMLSVMFSLTVKTNEWHFELQRVA